MQATDKKVDRAPFPDEIVERQTAKRPKSTPADRNRIQTSITGFGITHFFSFAEVSEEITRDRKNDTGNKTDN
jgi:hypothetical protein